VWLIARYNAREEMEVKLGLPGRTEIQTLLFEHGFHVTKPRPYDTHSSFSANELPQGKGCLLV
jgi:hypothetical protein